MSEKNNTNVMARFLNRLAEYKEFACNGLKFTPDSEYVRIAAKRPDQDVACNIYYDTITKKTYVRTFNENKELVRYALIEKNIDGMYEWTLAHHNRKEEDCIYVELEEWYLYSFEIPGKDKWHTDWTDNGRMQRASQLIDEDWAWHKPKPYIDPNDYYSGSALVDMQNRFEKARRIEICLDQIANHPDLEKILQAGEYGIDERSDYWQKFCFLIFGYQVDRDFWPDSGGMSSFLHAEADRIHGRPEKMYCY
jgi:hypothetical protein